MATTRSYRIGRVRRRLALRLMRVLNESGKPNVWFVDPARLNSNFAAHATAQMDGVSWDGYATWIARPTLTAHVYSWDTMGDLLRGEIRIVGKFDRTKYVPEIEVCLP